MEKDRAHLVRDFRRAPEVRPRGITGRERPAELLAAAFPAYVGRQERTAFQLMKRSVEENAAVFLTLSGAMTPAGLHQSCLIPLIQQGHIDCITTTGANLYHDAHRLIGHRIREIDPNAGDVALRVARIIRIYDLGMDEDVLLQTDKLFSWLLQKPVFQRKMTTPELHYLLGKELYQIEKALGVEQPSLLSTAYKYKVPIFVGAVQDGSIFLNIVKLKRLLGDAFKLEIDVAADVFAMGAIQFHCFSTLKKKMAIWILGGGVPKNYTLQGEPLLDQILNVRTDGFDIDVQFCVDPVDNGALSSCPAGEGHTWGKVSQESVQQGSVYCHCDVTAVFPWITYALLSEPVRKEPLGLYEQLSPAINELQRQVDRQRSELAKTLSFHLQRPEPAPRKARASEAKAPRAGEGRPKASTRAAPEAKKPRVSASKTRVKSSARK
ncbi:MAG: deoxyhypusine synthase family protein [Polyangiaceae bacterium]|jgi:deoxyhypusine synthase|nr:deoxyhypusine synthase family protein [Polyangiaceae bacterium]